MSIMRIWSGGLKSKEANLGVSSHSSDLSTCPPACWAKAFKSPRRPASTRLSTWYSTIRSTWGALRRFNSSVSMILPSRCRSWPWFWTICCSIIRHIRGWWTWGSRGRRSTNCWHLCTFQPPSSSSRRASLGPTSATDSCTCSSKEHGWIFFRNDFCNIVV